MIAAIPNSAVVRANANAERDAKLIKYLKLIVRENMTGKVTATKLMADAAAGNYRGGWREDAEAVVAQAFPGSAFVRKAGAS